MSGLGPEARALLEQARGGDEPTEGDRARVRKAVLTRLGAGIAAATVASSTGTAAAAGAKVMGAGAVLAVLPKVLFSMAAVGAIGLGYHLAAPPPAPTMNPAVVSAGVPREGAPAPSAGMDPSPQRDGGADADEPESGATAVLGSASSPRGEPLAEELEAVRVAHEALRDGDPQRAIGVLDQEQQQRDHGQLEEEREALRVLSLCKLGDAQQARSAAEGFLSRWPRSPQAPRVRRACFPDAGLESSP